MIKGLVRSANGFVAEGKRTKHAEFGYPVTKSISSDAQDSSDRFSGTHKSHNDCTSNGLLCPFCPVESFEHAQNLKPDETDITGQGADSPDKK